MLVESTSHRSRTALLNGLTYLRKGESAEAASAFARGVRRYRPEIAQGH